MGEGSKWVREGEERKDSWGRKSSIADLLRSLNKVRTFVMRGGGGGGRAGPTFSSAVSSNLTRWRCQARKLNDILLLLLYRWRRRSTASAACWTSGGPCLGSCA